MEFIPRYRAGAKRYTFEISAEEAEKFSPAAKTGERVPIRARCQGEEYLWDCFVIEISPAVIEGKATFLGTFVPTGMPRLQRRAG